MSNDLSKLLLNWYDKNGRRLPWRVRGGAHPDPYVILVSELMLQQTTVKTVIPYFQRFMERFPTVQSLAEAPLEEVYFYWQGLGYYTRARSLHATAGIIVSQYGGKFPQTRQEVLKLKGIGSYTVASFLALAFNQPETVVDGNVIRIICRLYNLTEPVDEIAGLIRQKAEALTDRTCPADYASAIMDLGAGICTPKNPQCLLCPWQNFCRARGLENLENIPRRKKSGKKEKTGFVYLIHNNQNEILIRQRTEKGLLSGLYEFPWSEEKLFAEAEDTGLEVSHVFTHIKLTLRICLRQDNDVFDNGRFVPTAELSAYPYEESLSEILSPLNEFPTYIPAGI